MKRLAVLCLTSLLVYGCATIYTQTSNPYIEDVKDCPEEKTIPNVYSGLIFDLYCIPAENVGFFCVVDLPLSAALDTAILPFTIYKQIEKGDWYSKKDCQNYMKSN
ncbi:MAG: hypothetical protein R3310_05850 [Candidatus Competibacteraceae bacterium]|nr:hypothetical protein [Candidatus Competibacteraceae bacterium]